MSFYTARVQNRPWGDVGSNVRFARKQTRLGDISTNNSRWLEPTTTTCWENGAVVGRIFFLDAVGPSGRPWMWANGHNGDIKRAGHGYEATREAAMAAFAKSGGEKS